MDRKFSSRVRAALAAERTRLEQAGRLLQTCASALTSARAEFFQHHEEGLVDLVELGVRQAGLQVQPEDLGAQRTGQGKDLEAHAKIEAPARGQRKASVRLGKLQPSSAGPHENVTGGGARNMRHRARARRPQRRPAYL